jgi:hypothetical protein
MRPPERDVEVSDHIASKALISEWIVALSTYFHPIEGIPSFKTSTNLPLSLSAIGESSNPENWCLHGMARAQANPPGPERRCQVLSPQANRLNSGE